MAEAGFEPSYFAELARIEPESFWFRARNRLLVSAFRRHFRSATSLFDVGCGDGFVLAAFQNAFPELRLGGAELFAEGLELARRRLPDAELIQVDARSLPYEEEWDVAGCFDVLEHVEEDERVLAKVHRALRPRGGLLLLVPQHRWLWSDADRIAHHIRRYSRRELVAKLRAAKFELLSATSFVSLLLPALALGRLRRLRPEDVARQLRPPKPVNAALERVLDFERFLIEGGLSLPIGGSLLVAARKMPA
jgi:SAM-dependent methyltransferase